jgi:hypothetical protein
MDFIYTYGLRFGPAALAAADMRAAIVMTNTTADTDEDAEFMDDFGTLDEYDSGDYARQVLAAEAAAVVTASDRYKWSSDPIVWDDGPGLAVGTRQGQAIILYVHVTNNADSTPYAYKEPTGFPFTGNGAAVTVNPHADGWSYQRNAD